MSNALDFKIGLPSVIAGSAKEMRVAIARDPAGECQATESFAVDGDADSINIEASEGSHITISVKAIDDKGQESKPIIKRFQARDPLCPVLADDMTVEVITDDDSSEEFPAEE